MEFADVTLAVFTFFNSLRFLAYVPQIARAARDQSGAEAISFGTWALFLVSHASAMAYAIENQRDWTIASLFLSNALGCGAILLIAAWKRSRHRRHGVRPSKVLPRITAIINDPPRGKRMTSAGMSRPECQTRCDRAETAPQI